MSAQGLQPHRDAFGARLGMWLFLVTELLLFGGLLLAYAYLRHRYPREFHEAGAAMNVPLGLLNTAVLLTSSLTVVLACSALARGRTRRALGHLAGTLGLGSAFLVIKGFEWSAKVHHGLYPGSRHLAGLAPGEQVFIGLYYTMTGLHGLHVAVGLGLFAALLVRVARRTLGPDHPVWLENGGLYWHLVDVIWIFLFPLFYLAA